MIGTFFNLCRACPSSMPLDKLHSEYKSTYRWHDFSAGPEVVRKPPMPNQFASSKDHFFSKSTEDEKHSEVIKAPINEPPLPRRKKCPELAYRHHEFIVDHDADRTDSSNITRARSGDRNGTPTRRSKSEGPPLANGRCVMENNVEARQTMEKAGESSGIFRKTISKLSTEYRLQFVWPTVRKVKGVANNDAHVLDPPKKSQSMGAIKSAQANTLAGIHKKRTTNEKEATDHELEPLVCDTVDAATTHEKKDIQNEYRKNFKSAFHSEKEKYGFEHETLNKVDNKVVVNGSTYDPSWYKEVIELRKKAGEYRNRGWCGETSRELYKKQQDLWKEVSRRSSLSALSLASSIKQPITKEDKDRENKIKSSPTKPSRRIPGSARLIDNRTATDGNLFGRFRRDNIRHHLERTTGSADVEEGALIPSPTREKLMPTLPRSKTGSPSRGSPQKTFSSSRHGSPLKGSPQKSPKKISKVGRSQSVGPTVSEGSPKKQPKPMSASITASTASSSAKAHNKKTPVSTPTAGADHHARQIDENAVDGAPQIFQPESIEQIVKSPPEPTRVKSPEQIVIMRSPDPVFWTVPLDTGKTFTVTQNVRSEGDANIVRPHSELKVTTPSEAPNKLLPQEHPQSAPPELWEEDKPDFNRSPKTGQSDDKATKIGEELLKPSQEKTQYDRPVPGSTLRCLDDPGINSPPSGTASRSVVNPATIEVVDKARDRFDRFWGGSNTDDQK
ncbi:unnamed protein product [Chironomus riparius]|uniref:Nuclear protein MDM1 n=1 Tax=Chironomus riparius TaxID=315576 RepID=A0A9P0J961_9DIPT|nr:unnamed protein product [Chironomus riparius]